jgi:beta-aspartyl-peptidase (threonine type)
MRTRPALIALAALAIVSAAPPDDDRTIVRDVRAVLDRQVADWNRKDLDGFCEGYWKSPDLVFQSAGDKTRGWQGMHDRYKARYQGEGREMGTLAFVDLDVMPLGPDSSYARGRWELSLSGGKTAGGLFTVIFRKKAEGWKIVHDHTSADAK